MIGLLTNSKKREREGKGMNLKRGGNVWDVIKSPFQTIGQLFNGVDRFNNLSKNTIKKYGNEKVSSFEIARTPLNKILEGAVNGLSFGKFSRLTTEAGHDALFHLSLIITLENGVKIIYEKNETVDVELLSNSSSLKNTSEFKRVGFGNAFGLTLNKFIKSAIDFMGLDKYFSYSALLNNCQNFIQNSLKSIDILTPADTKFLYQDFSHVRKELNKGITSYVEPLMNGITNLGSRATLLYGKGDEIDTPEKRKIYNHLKKHSSTILKFIKKGEFKFL